MSFVETGSKPARPHGWRKFWYSGDTAGVRGRDLCYSIGLKPGKGKSMQIPEWAVVIGRVCVMAEALKPGVRGALRQAAKLLAADPELAAAVMAAERLGGGRAALKALKAIGIPEKPADVLEREELARHERKRRTEAAYARRMLAMHRTRLAREDRLVKKWAKKVRRFEKEGF